MRMDGKVAVVTGAAQGIGAAIAKRLADDGAKVVLLDMNAEKLEAAANAAGNGAYWKVCNVADVAAVNEVFGDIIEKEGKVDILVNNAGITRDAMFHKMEEAQWDAVLDVKLKVIFNCCKAVVPGMR